MTDSEHRARCRCHRNCHWTAEYQAGAIRAAMRADAFLGDTDGFFVWKRIVRAIDDLSQTNRRPGEQGH